MKCHVFVDFDGTIAPVDTTDLLLERFADPAWHKIEDDWKAGRIGSRECLVRQIDLVRATPAALDAFVDSIEIDPHFKSFVGLCREHGHTVSVVSDGLDRTVGAVLARAGIDLPTFANHLAWLGDDRWKLTFPFARGDCRALSGNCKCQFAEAAASHPRIMIGDGRSDFCIAGEVDLVLAKSALERHCKTNNIPYISFSTFADASRILADWIENNPQQANVGQAN